MKDKTPKCREQEIKTEKTQDTNTVNTRLKLGEDGHSGADTWRRG